MENIKRVLSYTRRAVDDYEMIRDGDNSETIDESPFAYKGIDEIIVSELTDVV